MRRDTHTKVAKELVAVAKELTADTRILTEGQMLEQLSGVKRELDRVTLKMLKGTMLEVNRVFGRTQSQVKALSQLKADAKAAGNKYVEGSVDEARARLGHAMWAIDAVIKATQRAQEKVKNAQRVM